MPPDGTPPSAGLNWSQMASGSAPEVVYFMRRSIENTDISTGIKLLKLTWP